MSIEKETVRSLIDRPDVVVRGTAPSRRPGTHAEGVFFERDIVERWRTARILTRRADEPRA